MHEYEECTKSTHYFLECETRSVTPTSEIADKHVDIDEEFSVVKTTKTTKKFALSTKSEKKVKSLHKRA